MDTEAITHQRLEGWKTKLAQSTATPIALLAVGQDAHKGELVICVCENGLPIGTWPNC